MLFRDSRHRFVDDWDLTLVDFIVDCSSPVSLYRNKDDSQFMTTAPRTPRRPHDKTHPASQSDSVHVHIMHLEQYKMLREEIMQNIRVMDTVQYVALLGSGAIYHG